MRNFYALQMTGLVLQVAGFSLIAVFSHWTVAVGVFLFMLGYGICGKSSGN
jgi:hypothetical protein